MAILTVDNISKNYGHIKALKGISFSVPKGCVFGILGPNGSGKTTLLGIIMNVLKATGGQYKLFDEIATDDHRKKIGTLLETPNFYHYLSAIQNLKITTAIKGQTDENIDSVLHTVNLLQRKNSPFSSYSLGMKQRLAIGAALLGDPEVLVLDEPTNGLDPVGIAEIRALIKELSRQGKTIIMASHLLDEVEKVCTHVAILKEGNLLATGSVKEIFNKTDVVQLASINLTELKLVIEKMPSPLTVIERDGCIELSYNSGEADLSTINKFCFENNVVLSHLQLKKSNFESKFLELTN